MAKVTAVIDIGSNSARMVVFERTSRFGFHMLNESKSKVRISEDAYKNGGNLQKEPMQRAYDTLCNFISIAKSYKVRKILCVATSALRDAPNKNIFINRVKKDLKINIKVIDGKKEAYLGGVAVANLMMPLKSAITVDIGGGSTEFTHIQNKDVLNPLSLDLGAVRLKELFFDKNDIEGAKKYIKEQLKQVDAESVDTIVGIGGTFRAITKALQHKQNYPLEKIHGYEIDKKSFEKLLVNILKSDEQKFKKLNIKEDRIDVIKPGALILLEIYKHINPKKIIASGVGVREGLFLTDLLRNQNHKFPQNFNPSIRYLQDSFIRDKKYANLLAIVAKKIFLLSYQDLDLDKKYLNHLYLATKLFPIGSYIHFFSKNKHSYYIIQANLEYGFSHNDIMLISTIARYAKRKTPSQKHYEKYKALLPKKDIVDKLSYLSSIAIALLTHRPKSLDFDIEYKNRKLYIISKNRSSLRLSKEAVMRLEKSADLDVEFV